MSRSRITGTVEEAVHIEESILGRKLPPAFRLWLLDNNAIDLDDVHVFPVRDERDTRKTWESLSYFLFNEWSDLLKRFSHQTFAHLLPFATYGTTFYFCFDFSKPLVSGDQPVVVWSSETGEARDFADSFLAFVDKIENGSFTIK